MAKVPDNDWYGLDQTEIEYGFMMGFREWAFVAVLVVVAILACKYFIFTT